MATSAPGPSVYLPESRQKMFDLIKKHATKSELQTVISNTDFQLKMDLTCPEGCLGDEKIFLVVIGKPPHHVRGMVMNEKEEIHEIYTFHIDEF